MPKTISISQSNLQDLIVESVVEVLSEAKKKKVADRHEYWAARWKKQKAEKAKAEKNKPDRHEYWAARWKKQKAEKEAAEAAQNQTQSEAKPQIKQKSKSSKKDRHRPGYYRDYNKAHPERLDRGFTKGYNNGCVSDGRVYDNGIGLEIRPGVYIRGYDELGLPITNDPLGDMIRNREMQWHDDDWCEGSWDD